METLSPLVNSSPHRDRPGELRRRADRDGYLFFRRLVAEEAIQALAAVVRRECRARGFARGDRARAGRGPIAVDTPEFVALQCGVLASPEFAAVGNAPGILQVLESIMGGPVSTRRGDCCRVVAPGQDATLPHQDHHYVGGRADLWTAWTPLTDCPRSLGPLAVRPGSHLDGPLPHDGDGAGVPGLVVPAGSEWAGADLGAGDVLLFSGLTVHRSLPNLSGDRLRLSVDYRYLPSETLSSPGDPAIR